MFENTLQSVTARHRTVVSLACLIVASSRGHSVLASSELAVPAVLCVFSGRTEQSYPLYFRGDHAAWRIQLERKPKGRERQMFQLCNGCLDLFVLWLKWKYQRHLHHQDADLRFGKVMWSEQARYSSCLDHMLCYLLIHFEPSPLSSSTATEIFDSMTDSKSINWSINKPDHTAVGHFRFWSISDWRPASKSIPAIHVVCEKEDRWFNHWQPENWS